MLLSIIIPYYNSDKWIAGLLDSLLDQNLPVDSYEIIVVDDVSSEEPKTVFYYVNSHTNIFYYKLGNKGGPSGARNFGIKKAKGEWVYFCDSDDYVQSKVFGPLIEIGKKRNAELIYCEYNVVWPTDTPQSVACSIGNVSEVMPGLSFIVSYPYGLSFGVWSYLIRKDVIIKNHLFFHDLVYVEDRLFMLEWLPVVERIIYVDVVLYYYVQRKTSILHDKKRKNYEAYANYMIPYQDKLVEMINNSSFPEKSRQVFKDWLDDSSFFLLTNLFRYSSVRMMKSHIARLAEIGAYPIRVIGEYRIRLIRRIINHYFLWFFACRIYHLLPKRVRVLL